MRPTSLVAGLFFLADTVFAQAPELGQGWLPEFNLAARQIVSLAEAIPADKYSWRPAPGVRSISEVYMHIVLGNLYFINTAGGKADMSKFTADSEKSINSKAEVVKWLKTSMDAVRENYPKLDLKKKVTFLKQDSTAEFVMLRLLIHTNEHMGQSIAYARQIGVVPPWSK